MTPISQRFAIPTDPDAFEKICRDLLRRYWSRPGLEIFGKCGERQYGIDILDLGGETPIYAAQCKLKEEHKNLPPADIQEEVDKAKQFTPALGKYAILTTAKISAQAQRKVREINESHKIVGLFEVELLAWEQLCALLQQYTEVQEHSYGGVPFERAARIEAQLLTIKDGVQTLTSKGEGDVVDSQINEARDCIVQRDFQLATLLLNLVQRNHGNKLTGRQRFRVLSNHGAAALGLGKSEVAAKFFMEAIGWQPEDEQAKINEVLAYVLVGDMSTGHVKAERLRKEYPGSSRVAALWLMSAPKEAPFSAVEAEINTILRMDPEVCVALARKALMEFAFDDAFKYASSASKSAPKWSQPQLVLAHIDFLRAIHLQWGFHAGSGSQESSLAKAEKACSLTLDLARAEKDQQTEMAALLLRVDIQLLQKAKQGAIEDAEKAKQLDGNNIEAMLAVAQVRLADGRIDEHISILKQAYGLQARFDIAFLYAKALFNRGRDGDAENALNALLSVSLRDSPPELRPAFVTQVLQCFAKKKDWPGAEKYLDEVSEFLDDFALKIIRGYLAHYQGQSQKAERYALDARSLLTPKENADTKESLAGLLMLVGRPTEALPLWQDLFDRESPAFDAGNLLNCAARLHKDDLVMQTCDRLHGRGIANWRLLEFEISYLEKYKINVAIDRLQDFIARHPAHKVARLRLSMIGLRLNRADLVQGHPEDLPLVNDLPLNLAVAAVQILKWGGDPDAAVDYAYRFLRTHFNEIEAHQALLVSMIPGSAASQIPSVLEVVGPNAAVCYQEIPQGNPTWVVLENTDNPSGDFEEIPLTSSLAIELSGKTVGDTVVIGKGAMQDRTAKILAVLPKYVRRFQDSMGEMQVRFGAASTVESIRIEQSDDGNRPKGIEVILASVEKRAAAAAKARDLYHSQAISLHLYGARFGHNAYFALLDLANEETARIKCCFEKSDERHQALTALQTAKGVIIDITALATLRLLDLEKVLSLTRLHFIVSERTWITFQEMLLEARTSSAPAGTLTYKNGKHIMYEETAEHKEQRDQKDRDFVRLIEKTTELRSGDGLAALQPDKRQALEKIFGSYGAESMVLASDPDYVLWTDDSIQAQASAHEFGSRRVWTQLVLGVLTDAGLLTSDEYSEASAALIGMGFVATLFDSATVLAAMKLAGWSIEKRPATQMMAIFSDSNGDLQQLFRIYVQFTIRLYREPLSPETRCAISQAFLETFARRTDAMTLLTWLRQQSSDMFGVNMIGRDQFNKCFDRWLKGKDTPLIYSA